MTKRPRSKGRKEAVEGSASENSSKQTSPVASDSDETEQSPPPKKQKTENGGKRAPKTSADICEQFGLQDVDLEYTVADYQNLTNYGLFVRMVRPQVAAANAKIPSSRMVQLMEAKWREFRESNPLIKKRRDDDDKKEKPASDKKKKSKESKKKKTQEKKSKQKVKKPVISSDDESNDEKTEEEDPEPESNEEEEEEEEEQPKRKSGSGLKIKLSLFSPKSAKKPKRDRRSGSSKKKSVVDNSDEEESITSSKKSSRVATPISRQSDTNEESSHDEEGSDVETPPRRSRAQPKRRSRSQRKVVQEEASSGDENEGSEDEFASLKRSKGKSKKREKTPPEDDDYEEDEEEEEDKDEELESGEDTPQPKKKRKSETPTIPGERKSERSRKSMASLISDKEFEKMLKEEAAEKKKAKQKKQKEKKSKKMKGKKGYWQEEDEEKDGSGDNSKDIDEADDHYWYCEVCKDGGDLLLCDTCPKSWHKDCAKIEGEIPDGDWSCPKCKGTYESEGEEDHHDLYCKECKDGGDVLLCDYCKLVYHPRCLNPPLADIPEGEWKCPRCVVAETPLKGRIRRILFWRWSHQLSQTDETDHTQSPQKKAAAQAAEVEQKEKEAQGATPVMRPVRQFLCRFEFHSFWDCEWISELQLEVHSSLQFHCLKRKFDLDEPPVLEDGSSWGRQRRKTRTEEDPHNLEERYYRYGVKPDWLQIHRIINHDGKEGGKNTRYLVKWRDLGYEDCTWESPTDLPGGLEDWDKHYRSYWDHRKEKLKPPKEKKKPKKADLKKKWEKQPDYITATGGKLHPYQLEGVNWMRFSWAQDTNIILADEMGLGKTIQAITILYTLWKEGYTKGPFLISAPLSTVPNWEREFEFWAPDLYVLTYNGTKEARAVIREHEFSYDEDPFHWYAKSVKMRSGARPKFDVLLTSYEMVNMDRTTLSSINWEMLVVDEAHRLKSQQSLFFQTLSKYKLAFKLLLTGTPLQNNLEELFNLLNFLEPKTFTSMEDFLDEFSDINKDEQVTRLHEMLAPHMLRRLKLDVLTDLPSKSEFIVRVELAAMQKKFYKHILTKNYEALNVKGYANSTSLINIMMDLRKCCNHPYLFPAAEKEAPLTQQGLYEGNALIKACGKLELLSKMLHELKKQNHRVLIFSQMTRALDILEDYLSYEGYGYERIDGSITGKLRQESIDRFNNPESQSFVFLLSTKAGGLGINLATADTVIIYDMDWNPHNDIQALSRAHRIGQRNRVLIYRFVSRNTVEERITEVAKKKMMLTELVIHRGMGSEKQESISKKEVSEILKFGAEELFKDNEEGSVVWTDEAINKLLDRTQEGDTPGDTEKEAQMGMNEYLRSFKVASYHVKEGQEEAEKEKEEEEEEEEEQEQDNEYWRRVLGDAYEEHRVQLMQQEEEVARSLGKGKRVRRQVNYAEVILPQREQSDKEALKAKGKKEEVEEEEEEVVEEEAKYMSDYEPDEDETSEEEEEPEEPKSDADDADWSDGVKDKDKKGDPRKRICAGPRPPKRRGIGRNGHKPRSHDSHVHHKPTNYLGRRKRWTSEELHALVKAVTEEQDTLNLKGARKKLLRDFAWRRVTDEVNMVSKVGRTVNQVRGKLRPFVSECQQKQVAYQKLLLHTDPDSVDIEHQLSPLQLAALQLVAFAAASGISVSPKPTEQPPAEAPYTADQAETELGSALMISDEATTGTLPADSGRMTGPDTPPSNTLIRRCAASPELEDFTSEISQFVAFIKETMENLAEVIRSFVRKIADMMLKLVLALENTAKIQEGIVRGGRPSKSSKVQSNELPPLLAKVNGHTEVLGFTARQRRAFLDAVMRYGMPPEDGHQSQWLVRDLRNKTERVFRAYVSLFMRHLCEAVTDSTDKFSDGVPREGLSRQHVLTRIGIIALIRRKVQEFEEKNGTDSMIHYKKKSSSAAKDTVVITIPSAKSDTIDKTNKAKSEAEGKDSKENDVKDEKKEKTEAESPDKKEEDAKKESSEEKESKKEKEASEKTIDVDEEETKPETKKEEEEKTQKDKEQEDEEEEMEVDEKEEEKKDEEEKSAKRKEVPQVDGAGDDSSSSEESAEESEADEETTKEKEKEKEESQEKRLEGEKEEKEGGKGKDENKEKSEDKMEVDEEDGDKEVKEEKDGESSEKSDKKKESEKRKEEESGKSDDEKEGEKTKEDEKSSNDKEDEKSKQSKEKDDKGKDDKEKVESADKSKEKGTDAEKKPSDSKTDDGKSPSGDKKENVKIVVDLRKQAWELRRIFYIADGGFTELHALWQYEEQQLKPGREYETWHRRHDYWLLAGIITHGYRHWQDILNDPRFEMLNRAFQSDAEKMRKAAFLNRRFQLLEQALVIEEQLHKAVLQSPDLYAQLRKNCRGDVDAYGELDQLAILLRQIARRGATQDPHLAKVLAQLESLVGDIKHSTNSVVPATLARAPGVVIRQTGQQGPGQRPHMAMARPSRPVQQVVIPRHVMEQQRRNTPSPNSKR